MKLDLSSTPVRLGGFVLGLAAVFALAVGIGKAVGPATEPISAGHGHDQPSGAASTASGDGHGAHGAATPSQGAAAKLPGGLQSSQDGYTIEVVPSAGVGTAPPPVIFEITGPDGKRVTAYDVQHEKRLHLIAVRRDYSGFQHVHPELKGDGTWSTTDLTFTPGTWRLFADFKATGGQPLTLGIDLQVAGAYTPAAPAPEVRTATVDGYTVTLAGDLTAGGDSALTLTVAKDGKPITDLQPYLGAYGHLVALREGDLAYLHVHPDGEPGDGRTKPGPDVIFHTTVPSEGAYRLYLDFQHQGVVRTAAFSIRTR